MELDLQHEQLEMSERELTEDLVHFMRLYDFLPVASFSLGLRGEITRVNIAGAALCGKDRTALIGLSIDRFLAAESRPVLAKLAAQVRDGGPGQRCQVRSSAGVAYQVSATVVPGESSVLAVFMDLADSNRPTGRA